MRLSLHRCLQRYGIDRLPEVDGDKPKRFKAYPLGNFHIDPAQVHTVEGRFYLFVAIDRTTKFAFVELHEKATRRGTGDILRHLIEAVLYKVHTMLTDNGTHFTTLGNVAWPPPSSGRRLQPARPSAPTASIAPVPAAISTIA